MLPMIPFLRRLLATTALLLLIAPAAHAVDPDDLLPVDQAFALDATATARDRIELHWNIAGGYYLYRHRIDVQPVNSGFKPDPLQLPDGEKHTDEFFGEVETYRHDLTATLTGAATDGAQSLKLRVKYQGCADLGVCYPPQTRVLTVVLPANSAFVGAASAAIAETRGPATDTAANGSIAADAAPTKNNLAALFGKVAPGLFGGDEPLPPEQAFGFEAIAGDGNTVLLRFTPADGYYLYRDKTSLSLAGPVVAAAGITADALQWPPGVQHRDEYFGATTVYFDQVDVVLPLRRERAGGGELRVTATFQGCQTDGICYPPMTRTVAVALPEGVVADAVAGSVVGAAAGAASAATASSPDSVDDVEVDEPVAADATKSGDTTGVDLRAGADPSPPAPLPMGEGSKATASPGEAGNAATAAAIGNQTTGSNETAKQSEDQRLAAALTGAERWWALLGFLGAGLLLAFTPCVLPMIPILSGLIAGASARRGGRLSTGRALALSSVYVLASALVFTVAGVVAGLLGANLQVAFQTPWVIAAFAALFVALALAMFGLFELQLPAALRARLGAVADRQRGGSWAGVAAMGALSALIVGPCVAPPLAAAVLYIGQTQDPVFGGAALFLLAIGMGLPLLAFGVAAGRGLPTSGAWMTGVQRVFGFVFVGLAIWMLSRILPGPATLALWGLLALAAAAWAFGLAKPDTSERARWLARFAGLALAVIGAAQLLGALSGGSDPLRPLADLRGGAPMAKLEFRMIKSVDDLDRAIASAQASGQPLLLDFYADWCVACKEMEKYTFSQPQVHAALDDFVLLKADVTANDAIDQALMKRLRIIGPPATLFYVDGAEQRGLRLIGFEDAAAFVDRTAALDAAGGG